MIDIPKGYLHEYSVIESAKSFRSLDSYLDCLQDQNSIEILNMFGYFDYHFKVKDEELDYLAEKIGDNKKRLIPFISGTLSNYFDSLDKKDCLLAYMAYLLKNNSLYQGVQQEVLGFISNRMTKQKVTIKAKATGDDISKLYSFFPSGRSRFSSEYKGSELGRILMAIPSYDIECDLGELPKKYNALIEKARSFNKPILYHISISEKEEELLREASFAIFHNLYRNPVLEGLVKNGIGEDSILLLTLLCFSRNVEQEDNNSFWKPFSNWIYCGDIASQTIREKCISRAFSRIKILSSNIGTNRYVWTCHMHAIVANRRPSLEKLAQFFLKIYKRNGYITKGDWEDDIEEELVNSLTNKVVHDLPLETTEAYNYNDEETLDVLMGSYRRFLESIEDIIGTGSTTKNGDYIDDYLSSFLMEDRNANRAIKKSATKKVHLPPFIYLDLPDRKIKMSIRSMDDIESEYLSIVIGGKEVTKVKAVNGHTNWTRIDFEPSYLGKNIVFMDGERPMYSKTISPNLIFECDSDYHKQVESLRKVYGKNFIVVADKDEYEGNFCIPMGTIEETTGKPIVRAYAGDNCTFIYKDQISLPKGKKIETCNGITGDCLVDKVIYKKGGRSHKVYRSMPDFYITLKDTMPVSNLKVSVNGESYKYDAIEKSVSDEDNNTISIALIKLERQPESGTFIRLIASIDGHILFEDSFLLIKDFKYSFIGNSIFSSEREECEIDITCSDRKNLFLGKNYHFPMKRRVNELNFSINGPQSKEKLEITPCVIRFEDKNASEFHMNEVYSLKELFDMDKLSLTTEGHGFSLSVHDSKGDIVMRLKEVSEKTWKMGALKDLEDQTDLFSLCLIIDETQKIEICRFFSNPMVMPASGKINTYKATGDFALHEEGDFFHYVLYAAPDTKCSLVVESEFGHEYSEEIIPTIAGSNVLKGEIKINKKLLPGKYRIKMEYNRGIGFTSKKETTYSDFLKWGSTAFVSQVLKCKIRNGRIPTEKKLKNVFILFETVAKNFDKPITVVASIGSMSDGTTDGKFECRKKESFLVTIKYNKNNNTMKVYELKCRDDKPLTYQQLTGKESEAIIEQNTLILGEAKIYRGETI